MGWAEEAARKAREVVDASRQGVPSTEPREPGPGAAPSEFLEGVARGMLVDCMRSAARLQAVLSPPPAIVGPSGQAPVRLDPMTEVVAALIRIEHAQAATLDLMLTMLGCRPELRPMAAPANGNGEKPAEQA